MVKWLIFRGLRHEIRQCGECLRSKSSVVFKTGYRRIPKVRSNHAGPLLLQSCRATSPHNLLAGREGGDSDKECLLGGSTSLSEPWSGGTSESLIAHAEYDLSGCQRQWQWSEQAEYNIDIIREI